MSTNEPLSLGQALPREICRNVDLIIEYAALPNGSGTIAVQLLRVDIHVAMKAYEEADVVAMIRIYEKLKENGR